MTTTLPEVREHELLGRDDEPLTIRGRLLGFATSKRDIHTHPLAFANVDEINLAIEDYENRLSSLDKKTLNPRMRDQAVSSLEEYLSDLENAPLPVRYATPGERCSACRWFEVRIFAVEAEVDTSGECNCAGGTAESNYAHEPHCGLIPAGGRYLVLTYGLSDVPGEVAKRRTTFTDSPFTVIETLTQRRGQQAFLPATSARVLAEAAHFDRELADAYVNRAVA